METLKINNYPYYNDISDDINRLIDERIEKLQEAKTMEEVNQNKAFVDILQNIFDKFCDLDIDNMDYKELAGVYRGMHMGIQAINEYLAAADDFDAE